MMDDIVKSVCIARWEYVNSTGKEPYAICIEDDLFLEILKRIQPYVVFRNMDVNKYLQKLCGLQIKRLAEPGYNFYITGEPHKITKIENKEDRIEWSGY